MNRQLDTLRPCLKKAVEWGVIEKHPLDGLKRLKVDDDDRVRYLSADEEGRLRDALVARESNLRAARDRFNDWRKARHRAPLPARREGFVDRLRPLVLVALNTGLRRGELFSLRWEDVNFANSILTVRAAAAKSGNTRYVPMNLEAANALRGWKKLGKSDNGEDLVFAGAGGERLTNINKSWASVIKLAKIPNFRFHDCRHTFASKLGQRDVNLNTGRALLGHADLKMTLRYSHLRPENLSDAVAKLA